ncbi:PepSY-like domain-containing protein [Lacibacter luteus]|nr:PepSY-like domain-containing protein [Lacibacter luteus]
MKKVLMVVMLSLISAGGFAQAAKEKSKAKEKNKPAAENVNKQKDKTGTNANTPNADGKQTGNTKTRVNIPTKVKTSFAAEYPNAVNATWTKTQGDWTVVFGNGVWQSTATYHSNGERVDTRTAMPREQAPRPVLDEILRRYPKQNPKDIIKIEKPKNPNLFQIIVEEAGKKRTLLIDETGKLVSQQ